MPFALSESCFSSLLAVVTNSISGSKKRRTRALDGCFLMYVSTRSSTRFLKYVASRCAPVSLIYTIRNMLSAYLRQTYLSLSFVLVVGSGRPPQVSRRLPSFVRRPYLLQKMTHQNRHHFLRHLRLWLRLTPFASPSPPPRQPRHPHCLHHYFRHFSRPRNQSLLTQNQTPPPPPLPLLLLPS